MFWRRHKREEEIVRGLFSPIERVAYDRAEKLADAVKAFSDELHDAAANLKAELANGGTDAGGP